MPIEGVATTGDGEEFASSSSLDSAHAAVPSVPKPLIIRYSDRPDTLHLPGHPVGKSIYEVALPTYYEESYFKNDSMYHPEIKAKPIGVAGDPVPYTASTDDVIASMVLFFLVATMFLVPKLIGYYTEKLKEFFAPARKDEIKQRSTLNEDLMLSYFVLQTCVICGLGFFEYTQHNISDTFTVQSEYLVMGIFSAETLGWFFCTALLQEWTNYVFFPHIKKGTWTATRLLLHSLAGIALLPVFLLNIYTDAAPEFTLTCAGIVILFYEIMTFYRAYRTFFDRKALKLQIFLYLCTLEIIPLLILWMVLCETANTLTYS